jgi:hypothetical protein
MADVSVKMGVSGVAQFKKGMTDSQAAVKNLDAALKYNEKQMKASGNAEKDFTVQANLLNAKLKEQKNIVKNAENALKQMEQNGVQTTSAAYQNMQRRMIEAQSAILDTETALRNLGTTSEDVAGQTSQLQQSLGGLNKKVSLGQVQDALKGISGAMENAAKKAVDLGKAIWDNIIDTARYSDDVVTAATRLGISTDEYQQLKGVLDTVGDMTVEEWKKAKRKVQGAIYDPTGDQENILALLGIQTHEGSWGKEGWVQGAARDYEDVFWEIGETLRKKVESGEMSQDLAETYAQSLFGKGYDAFNGIFGMGRTAFEEAKKEQATASEEALKKNAELNDKIIQLQNNFDALKTELVSGLSPALTKVAETVSGLLKEFNDYLQTDEGKAKMEELSKAVEELFGGLSDITPEGVIDTAKDILDGIVESLKWIATNKDKVVTGIKTIIGAWAAVKTAQGITTMMNLVNGIKGISAGGAAATAGSAAGAGWGASFAGAALSAIKAVPWVAAAMALIYPLGEEIKQAGGLEVFGEGMLDTAKDAFDPSKWPDKVARASRSDASIPDLISYMFGGGGTLVEPEQKTGAEQERDTINTRILTEMMKSPEYSRAVADMMHGNAEAYNKIRESIVQQFIEAGTLTRDAEGNLHEPGFQKRVYVKGHGSLSVTEWDEYQENLKKLEEQGVTVPANLELEDAAKWAADAVKQIGVVQIPAQFTYWGMQTGAGGAGDPNAYYTMGLDQASHPHVNGIWSAPFDGYHAVLHKGERVVPAREVGSSRNFSSNLYVESMIMNNGTDAEGLAAAMAAAQRRTMSGYGN